MIYANTPTLCHNGDTVKLKFHTSNKNLTDKNGPSNAEKDANQLVWELSSRSGAAVVGFDSLLEWRSLYVNTRSEIDCLLVSKCILYLEIRSVFGMLP